MSKKPIVGMKRIAEALDATVRPDRELFEQVGRAIVGLSDVESALASALAIMNRDFSAAQFFEREFSLDKKLAFFDVMVRNFNRPEATALWLEIFAELKQHKGIRNMIAHQGLVWDGRDVKNPPKPILWPRGLPLGIKRGRELGVAEIKKTADALEALYVKTRKLLSVVIT